MAEFPRIFNHASVSVSRRVSDGLASKWTSILEELDEQFNLKISFRNKTHMLEGQWCDIIKAHNLILHQLELQKVFLPDETIEFSPLQSYNPSLRGGSTLHDESGSCRLSMQGSHSHRGSAAGDADVNPHFGRSLLVADSNIPREALKSSSQRPKSSTPINTPQDRGIIIQGRHNLVQEKSEATIPMQRAEGIENSMLSRTLTSETVTNEFVGDKRIQVNNPIQDDVTRAEKTTEGDVSLKGTLTLNLNTENQNNIRQEKAEVKLPKMNSEESFASSMPSLEAATIPDAENSCALQMDLSEANFQCTDDFTLVSNSQQDGRALDFETTDSPKVSHADGGRKDDIQASMQLLENEHENAKRHSSEDGDLSRTDSEDYLLPSSSTDNKKDERQDKTSLTATSPRDQRQVSSPIAKSSDREEVQVETTYVDSTTWKFMNKAYSRDLEDIKRRNNVSFVGDSNESDLCCITITSDSKDANVKKAHQQFSHLYEQTMEDCVQYPLTLARQCTDEDITRAVARIKEIYPNLVITPTFGNSRELTFICRSHIIKEIADNFRELIGMIPPRDIPNVSGNSRGIGRGSPVIHATGSKHYGRTEDLQSERRPNEGSLFTSKQENLGKDMYDELSGDSDGEDTMTQRQSGKRNHPSRSVDKNFTNANETHKQPASSARSLSPEPKSVKAEQRRPKHFPSFDIAEEIKTMELSKSQSPSLQLLYELLMNEDPSNEIEKMVDRILRGEPVEDTGSGYFQDGLYTGDPTEKDQDKNTEETFRQNGTADYRDHQEQLSTSTDSDSGLYGNFSQSTGEGTKAPAMSIKSTENSLNDIESSDDDLYVNSKPNVQQAVANPVVTTVAEPDPSLSSNKGEPVAKEQCHGTQHDTDDESSSDDDDLYGEFRKSVSGSGTAAFSMLSGSGSAAFSKLNGSVKPTGKMAAKLGQDPTEQNKLPQTGSSAEREHSKISSVPSVKVMDSEQVPVMSLPIRPAGYQPKDGDMHLLIDKKYDIPGHPDQGAMVVTFDFEDGDQDPHAPREAKNYRGIHVSALLPNSVEGKIAYKVLKKAFDERKLFTTEEQAIVPRIAIKGKRSDYPAPGYVETLKTTLENLLNQ